MYKVIEEFKNGEKLVWIECGDEFGVIRAMTSALETRRAPTTLPKGYVDETKGSRYVIEEV